MDRSLHSRRKLLDNGNSSKNKKLGGIEAELLQFNKANSSLGPHKKNGIRRIMSARMFPPGIPTGMGQFASVAGLGSGGPNGNFIGFSSSLGKSPPLKPFGGPLTINSPDGYNLMPSHFTLLIPPGGTTTEIGKVSNLGTNFVVGSAHSLENTQRNKAFKVSSSESLQKQSETEIILSLLQ